MDEQQKVTEEIPEMDTEDPRPPSPTDRPTTPNPPDRPAKKEERADLELRACHESGRSAHSSGLK